MPSASPTRTAVGNDNARHVPRDYLVKHFVATDQFWNLIRATNQVILGSRGSGKTSFARMLSHSHLSQLADDRAKEIIADRSFIGIYVPTKVEWVGGFYNMSRKHKNDAYFRWRLNVSTCSSFLETLGSCLSTYVSNGERVAVEAQICRDLAQVWLGDRSSALSIVELELMLERLDLAQSAAFLTGDSAGLRRLKAAPVLATPLLRPLAAGIKLVNARLGFTDNTVWAVCFDEAESLRVDQQRVVNMLMRAHSGVKLAIKMATTPYGHLTLETTGAVPLNQGHDFEYVYIDIGPASQSPSNKDATQLQQRILRRLFEESADYRNVSFQQLLGPSPLLDFVDDTRSVNEFMRRLERHATPEFMRRARRLQHDPRRFGDEIARKVRGVLALREATSEVKGNAGLEIYCGSLLALRCSDANPRKLIQIVNKMVTEGQWRIDMVNGSWRTTTIKPAEQTRIFKALAQTELLKPRSEPEVGEQLYELVNTIGQSLARSLHDEPITSDQYLSVDVGSDVTDTEWIAITKLVDLGILYPNIRLRDPNPMPFKEGSFRFSFFLCPHFNLLPRRGRSRSLRELLRKANSTDLLPIEDGQLDLLN
jgi:hypothetical protein